VTRQFEDGKGCEQRAERVYFRGEACEGNKSKTNIGREGFLSVGRCWLISKNQEGLLIRIGESEEREGERV